MRAGAVRCGLARYSVVDGAGCRWVVDSAWLSRVRCAAVLSVQCQSARQSIDAVNMFVWRAGMNCCTERLIVGAVCVHCGGRQSLRQPTRVRWRVL